MTPIHADPAPHVSDAIAAVADAMAEIEGPLPKKKRALVEAAIATFAEKGFDATSTKEIALRAGVAEATIFRHFGTKRELLLRLVRPVLTKVIVPASEAQLTRLGAEQTDLRTLLRLALTERIELFRRYAPLTRILIQELPFQPDLQTLALEVLPKALGPARDMIAAEIDKGTIRAETPERLMRWIGSLFMGYFITTNFVAPDAPGDDAAEIAAILDLVFDGIAAGRD